MNLRPINDRLIIKMIEPITVSEVNEGEPLKVVSTLAEIVAMGPEIPVRNSRATDADNALELISETQVKVGDKIMISQRWQGEDINHDGVDYKVINYLDVLAVVE